MDDTDPLSPDAIVSRLKYLLEFEEDDFQRDGLTFLTWYEKQTVNSDLGHMPLSIYRAMLTLINHQNEDVFPYSDHVKMLLIDRNFEDTKVISSGLVRLNLKYKFLDGKMLIDMIKHLRRETCQESDGKIVRKFIKLCDKAIMNVDTTEGTTKDATEGTAEGTTEDVKDVKYTKDDAKDLQYVQDYLLRDLFNLDTY